MSEPSNSTVPQGFEKLIPELPKWNNGKGIHPEDWIVCAGTFPLAIGYTYLFWPKLVAFEDYVLRDGFSEEAVRGFERQTEGNKVAVEAVMNHIHLIDLHSPDNESCNEEQLIHLGRILRDIYEAKLGWQFPDRRFNVVFDDEPGQHLTDYEVTFWQRAMKIEGGCHCGAVRYVLSARPEASMICHCRACRSISGAPVVAWISTTADALAFTKGEPACYASSPDVQRQFCAACGTQLTYVDPDYGDAVDVTTASLDDPDAFPPTHHSWLSHDIAWIKFGDGLPTFPKSRNDGD